LAECALSSVVRQELCVHLDSLLHPAAFQVLPDLSYYSR
jgi:hypothetical protein